MLHVRTKHLKSCAAHYIVQCNKGMNMTDTVNNETFETAAEQAEPVEAAVVEAVKKVNARRVKTERLGRQFTVGPYGPGVVADRSAEIELLVRNGAHPAPPVGEGEVRAAHSARSGALSYHLRKSGTSSSSAALSE